MFNNTQFNMQLTYKYTNYVYYKLNLLVSDFIFKLK